MLSKVTLSANTTGTLVATIRKTQREVTQYFATVLVYGTFNSGTVSLYLSPDGGATLIPLTSSPGGTGFSFTSNGMAAYTCGTPTNNTQTLQLWAGVANATGTPSVTIANYDNNG